MEQGVLSESDKGTPQGGLISPVLANIYLHYALDLWFEKVVARQCQGEAYIIRYADDFVCCFQYEGEAKRCYSMLKERMAKFGLQLAEDKSKIIRFGRYAKEYGVKETFDFLGFKHVNGVSKNGKYIVVHITSDKKLAAKKQAVKKWLRENMHEDKCTLVKRLNSKLIGHYRYYGVTGNSKRIANFGWYVRQMLYKTLNRRSQRNMSWETFARFLKYNPLANPTIGHLEKPQKQSLPTTN
jgi:hypothetical protein